MSDGPSGLTRVDLINQEYSREMGRKESLEKRGMTLITTSGVLVTLIFAFSGAVAKGGNFGHFTLAEKILIAIALGFFVVSAIFGVATNTPRNYAALKKATLLDSSGDAPAPNEPISETTLKALVATLETSRTRNDTKARALVISISLQVITVLVVSVTIMVVII